MVERALLDRIAEAGRGCAFQADRASVMAYRVFINPAPPLETVRGHRPPLALGESESNIRRVPCEPT